MQRGQKPRPLNERATRRSRPHVRVITPGAESGEPLHLLSALERRSGRGDLDAPSARAALSGAISLVLRLVGREGDPGRSKEHALLSVLAEARLTRGEDASLERLVADVMEPTVASIGAMAIDDFLPPNARRELAADLKTAERERAFLDTVPRLSAGVVGMDGSMVVMEATLDRAPLAHEECARSTASSSKAPASRARRAASALPRPAPRHPRRALRLPPLPRRRSPRLPLQRRVAVRLAPMSSVALTHAREPRAVAGTHARVWVRLDGGRGPPQHREMAYARRVGALMTAGLLALAACSPVPREQFGQAMPDGPTFGVVDSQFVVDGTAFSASVETSLGPMARPSYLGAAAGARRVLSESVTETIVRVSAGVEQSWQFASRVPGPIHVRIETTATLAAAATDGLVLSDGDSRVHYSDASWIDADGTRTLVPARWRHGGIELDVPVDVVLDSAFPCVLDPLITVERAVFETTLTARSALSSSDPRGVWTGTEFAVLVDDRVVNVTSEGVVQHPGRARGGGPPCSLPFYWRHREAGYDVVCQAATGLAVHRTDEDMVVSTTTPVPATASGVVVAASTDRMLVLHEDVGRTRILGYLVELDAGTVLGPIEVATGPGTRFDASAAWSGETFVVAYTDDRYVDARNTDIRATTVSVTGLVSSVDGVIVAGSSATWEQQPGLIASPSELLLVWSERPSAATTCTTVTRLVRRDGTVSDLGVGTRSGDRCGDPDPTPGAWTGSAWLVHRGGSVLQRFVPGGSTGTSYSVRPASVTDGYSVHLIWGESTGALLYSAAGGEAYVLALDDTGPVAAQHPLLVTDVDYAYVDLVAGPGLGWFVRGVRTGGTIRGRYLGPDGVPIAPSLIAPEPTRVAPSEGRWLLATVTSGATELRWIDGRTRSVGSTVATLPRPDSATKTSLTHASGGFLWAEGRTAGMRVSRVRADGTLLDSTPQVLSSHSVRTQVAAAVGNLVFVVWSDARSGELDLYGARVDLATGIVDRTAIAVTSGGGNEFDHVVARSGDGWFVAWALESGGFAYRLVGADGVLGPVVSHPSTTTVGGMSAAWDGTRTYFVRREGFGSVSAIGMAILPDGRESIEEPLWSDWSLRGWIGLASLGASEFVAAYLAFDDWTQSHRVFSHHLSLDTAGGAPLGAPCGRDGECVSAHCVDGVCCDNACGGGAEDCLGCSEASGAVIAGLCGVASLGHTCRVASGACDLSEVCDGVASECGPDRSAADGTVCGASNRCGGSGACSAGACVLEEPITCDDEDACTADTCDPVSGCVHVPTCLDAGDLDASALRDAGAERDAGSSSDAAPNDAAFDGSPALVADASSALPPHANCSCTTPPHRQGPWPVAGLFVLSFLRLRRSRRRAPQGGASTLRRG
ncbi:MAG: hypothetical protein U0353_19880 [Sandaracinus sp.]